MTQVMSAGAGQGQGEGEVIITFMASSSSCCSCRRQLPPKGFPESGNSCFPANIKVCIIKSRTVQRLFARHEWISGFNATLTATGELPAVCHVEHKNGGVAPSNSHGVNWDFEDRASVAWTVYSSRRSPLNGRPVISADVGRHKSRSWIIDSA